MGRNPTSSGLKAWAARVLSKHVCQCEDCKSARAVLESITRAELAKLMPDPKKERRV